MKAIHKLLMGLTVKHHKEIYGTLNVTLSPKDYDPESWYGGFPHSVTGRILPKKYQIPTMINDLFGSIKDAGPLCISKDSKIVWSKGDGKPRYYCNRGGIYQTSSTPTIMRGFPPYPVKCKLRSDGTKGLGITIATAIVLWGKEKVLALETGK